MVLKEFLSVFEVENGDKLKVFGYVECIDELFWIIDCMIIKSGGIILIEVIVIGVFVILYKFVSGQEKENVNFFEDCGVVIVVNCYEEIFELVIFFFVDEDML